MKRFCACVVLLAGVLCSYAQNDQTEIQLEGDYLSVQVNELVRQIFSLGSTSSPANPYFINYTHTSASGSGLSVGLGYTKNKFSSSDQFNNITTNINDLAIRVGYDKKRRLSKKFVCSFGFDLTVDAQKNETVSEDSFSSQTVTTTDKVSGWGVGPRFTFHYFITENIRVGTEANYYYKDLKEKFSVDFSGGSSGDEERETGISRFTFSAPAILWLSIRL